jgi:sulfate transport system permease protein
MSILDLPFAISPVVTGLMLVLLYGRNGWFAPVLDAVGFNVVFAFPGGLRRTSFPHVAAEAVTAAKHWLLMQDNHAARILAGLQVPVFASC